MARGRVFFCWALLFCFLFFTSPALAGQKLTLAQAIGVALEENYEIRAFRNAVAAEKEGVGIARSQLLPRLSFEERAARTKQSPCRVHDEAQPATVYAG